MPASPKNSDSHKSDHTAADDNAAPPAPKTADTSDIAQMGYEQARDELASIVSTLESGRAPLEESMRLWERGEALAAHCQRWLDGAQRRIDTAMAERADNSSHSDSDSQ